MPETGADITGGCLCGAVRFRSTAAPIATRYCWCRDCQGFAAGGATVNVIFSSNAVTIEGPTTDYASTADSGNRMHRRFCPSCGTPLFIEAGTEFDFFLLSQVITIVFAGVLVALWAAWLARAAGAGSEPGEGDAGHEAQAAE